MRAAMVLAVVLAAASAAAAEPVRVATLVPYAETALGRLDGRVRVVAAVRRDMHRAPAPPIVDLGTPHAPSFEKLAEANATLVVGDRLLHAPLGDRLARTSAELLLLDSTSVDATFAGLVQLGRRVGATDEMTRAVDETRRALAGLALAKPVPALLLFGAPGSFLVISPRTWLGDLAQRIGFVNVAAAATGQERIPGFVQVSDEVLTSLRPELVLLVAHGDPQAIRAAFTRRLDEGGAWEGLRTSAVRGVHVLPPETFSTNPGLGIAEAARRLHDLAGGSVAHRP